MPQKYFLKTLKTLKFVSVISVAIDLLSNGKNQVPRKTFAYYKNAWTNTQKPRAFRVTYQKVGQGCGIIDKQTYAQKVGHMRSPKEQSIKDQFDREQKP